MIVDDLVELARSRFPAIITDLEFSSNFNTEEEKLLYLELYDLVSRDEIVEHYNLASKNYVNCTEYREPKELADRMFRLENSNLFVYRFNNVSKELIVVTSEFNKVENSIGVFFNEYDFNIFYITPLNYRILELGESCIFSFYDHILFYKRLIYEALSLKASDIHITNHQTPVLKSIEDSLSGGCEYEYKIGYRLLNNYEYVSKFKLIKSFNDEMIQRIVSDKTMGMTADLISSSGVKASWLNPLYTGDCDLRITCSHTRGGYTSVARVQTLSIISRTIKNLGFNSITNEDLAQLSQKEHGLTLITGPIRSGKNTTMNALVNNISDKPLKLMEFSSPIETSQMFEQYDYNDDRTTLLNYVNLVKKQDTDIVIINELPRQEVASAVIDLVNSSIGVMTTLHIDRVWDLPYKLKDYFGDSFIDLITHINGVVNQKMFVKQCPHCHVDTVTANFPKYVSSQMKRFNITSYKNSIGCPMCNGTGKCNSVQPFAEYLVFDKELKHKLLRCEKCYEMEDIIREEVENKHNTLEHYVAEAIKSGILHPLDFNKLE